MLEYIEINNFKCFHEVRIPFRYLNVLTGPNSSGKSTIIQALLFQGQSIDHNGQDTLNGKYVRLGTSSDVKNCYTRGDIKVGSSWKDKKNISDIVYLTTDRVGTTDDFKQNEDIIDDSESKGYVNEIGIHGEYAFDFLSRKSLEEVSERDFIRDEGIGVNLGNQVDYWLNYLCGYTIKAERIEGTSTVRVAYQTSDHVKEFRAMHIGTGVTYMAVIIITALSCTKNSLFIIENPELYLHPAAQSRFTELFSFLASRGLQVVIETHSDHIINGIRKEIKKGHIDRDEVEVTFLRQENGISFPAKIVISENGVIENPQKGFFDQFDDDLDALLGFGDE